MGRVRREAGVALGSGQAAPGKRRHVVGVDKVVGHARVLRLASGLALQDLGSLELPCVGLVGWRCSDGEREGVVDRHLRVIREAPVQPLHGLRVTLQAGAVHRRVLVAVELGDGVDEAGLALTLRPDAPRLCQQGPALAKVGRGGHGKAQFGLFAAAWLAAE